MVSRPPPSHVTTVDGVLGLQEDVATLLSERLDQTPAVAKEESLCM